MAQQNFDNIIQRCEVAFYTQFGGPEDLFEPQDDFSNSFLDNPLSEETLRTWGLGPFWADRVIEEFFYPLIWNLHLEFEKDEVRRSREARENRMVLIAEIGGGITEEEEDWDSNPYTDDNNNEEGVVDLEEVWQDGEGVEGLN